LSLEKRAFLDSSKKASKRFLKKNLLAKLYFSFESFFR